MKRFFRNLFAQKTKTITRRPRLSLEALDDRTLMAAALTASLNLADGVLRVEGTNGADMIHVRHSAGGVRVDGISISVIGGEATSKAAFVARTQITKIEVAALDGNDTVQMHDTLGRGEAAIPMTIHGASGRDTLIGGLGNDFIYGESGADSIRGGGGRDTLYGDANPAAVPASVSFYPGEENANDFSGGNHGVAHGDVAFAAGKSGQAFQFDGALDYVDLGGDATLDLPGSMSVSLWVRLDTLDHFKYFLADFAEDGWTSQGSLGTVSDASVFAWYQRYTVGWGETLAGTTRIQLNQWYHVSVVRDDDAKTVRLYVNGAEECSLNYAGYTVVPLQGSKVLGGAGPSWPGDFMDGQLDEVRIFNRALSYAEIQTLLLATDDAAGDILNGEAGDDTLFGGGGGDTLSGGAGHDRLEGGAGADRLNGESGNDFSDMFIFGPGWDTIFGGAGNDTIKGGGGFDSLFGGDHSDQIYGGEGNDTIAGENHNDLIYGDGGNDKLIGCFDGWHGETGNANDTIYGGTGIDSLYGGDGNDILRGEGDNNLYWGEDGNDTLIGLNGRDTMVGGAGNDTLQGGSGNDELYGEDNDDYITGGAGLNTLVGGNGADKLFGGEQADWLIGGHRYSPIETGGDGDLLVGYGGIDNMFGGDGSDTLRGGYGDDWLWGEDGVDHLYGDYNHDNLNGGRGNDVMDGGWGNDAMVGGEGVDIMSGGFNNDTLWGGAWQNSLIEVDTGNIMYGNDGNDNLYGGIGNDFMDGGADNDGLFGGLGVNTLRGMGGADRFLVRDDEGIDDLESNDARINFTAFDRAWTDQEIYFADAGLAFLHSQTNNTRLLKLAPASGGGELTFERLISLGGTTLADNDSMGWIRVADRAFVSTIPLVETIVHEIGHNWDDERGSTLWQQWLNLSGWRPHDNGSGSTFPPDGYVISGDGQWEFLASASNSFQRTYGKDSPFEDWCTMWEAYYRWKNGTLSAANATRLQAKLNFVDAFMRSQRG